MRNVFYLWIAVFNSAVNSAVNENVMNKFFRTEIDEEVMKLAEHLTEIAKTMDRKYGHNEYFKYVDAKTKERFDAQEKLLYKAISEKDKEKTLRFGSAMVRAWRVINDQAEANKAPTVDVDVWTTQHPLYPDVTINVTKTPFTRKNKAGEIWVSIDELIPFLTPVILSVKEKFSGSEIKGFYEDDIPF